MLIMGAVLLLLIGVADGVETFCVATQPHITTQCFGSLGGTVKVQLPKTSQDHRYVLKKNNALILSDRIQPKNIRYSFNVSTGMFAIKEFNRIDKGTYSIEVHNQSGTAISFNQFRLTIEGVKTFCDATQPHIPTQCFGSLGGTVEVHLPTHSPHEHSYTLKKNKVPIVEGEIKITDPRYSFNVSTGVFTIDDLKKSDYDHYSLAAHNGVEIATKRLSIQGVKSICDAIQPHITTQCSGSPGGTVEVQLPAKTSQDDIYKLKKNNAQILSGRHQTANLRYSLNVNTGLFAIKDIDWSDYGTYSMKLHDAAGRELANTKCNLTIQGVKTFCDATQPPITTQCFGSLGGTVKVLLPTMTSQNYEYRLKKNNVMIVEYKSQTKKFDYSFNVSTGIFTINDINRTEDDTYSFEAQNRNGINLSNIQFHLSIQAPVSSPLLSRECLSRGQQRVSCSAGGDGLHYSWSLDGLPLKDTRLLSGPSSASDVTLEPGRSGLLSCSVRNNVSHAAANNTLSVCDGFIYVNCTSNGTHISQWVHRDNNTLCPETAVGPGCKKMELVPIVAGSLSAMALLLIVALGVYCAKKHKTSKDTTEAEDVIYADVSVLQRRGQRREQGEGEVEYGAVREAPGPGRTLETNVDECVDAQPQSTRP